MWPFTRGQAALWEFLLGHPKQSRTSLATRQEWANPSCEMVAQSGRIAAYKPFTCFLLLTFPGQPVCPWFLCWKGISQKSRTDADSALAFRVKPHCQGWTRNLITTAQTILLQRQLQGGFNTPKPVCQRCFTKTSQNSTIFIKTKVVIFPSSQQRFRDVSCLFSPDRQPKLVFPQLHGLSRYFLEVQSKVRLLWFVIMSLFQ